MDDLLTASGQLILQVEAPADVDSGQKTSGSKDGKSELKSSKRDRKGGGDLNYKHAVPCSLRASPKREMLRDIMSTKHVPRVDQRSSSGGKCEQVSASSESRGQARRSCDKTYAVARKNHPETERAARNDEGPGLVRLPAEGLSIASSAEVMDKLQFLEQELRRLDILDNLEVPSQSTATREEESCQAEGKDFMPQAEVNDCVPQVADSEVDDFEGLSSIGAGDRDTKRSSDLTWIDSNSRRLDILEATIQSDISQPIDDCFEVHPNSSRRKQSMNAHTRTTTQCSDC